MLELKNINKTLGENHVLKDLTMTVPKGAVYGLVGPNGAGKTTAIRHIMGIYRPDSGTVTVDGSPVYENPEIKARMAYIPDEIFFFPSATLEDMHRYYRGIYKKFDEPLFQRLSEVFPLPPKSPIRRYSKGMQKQAAFYLSICTRPEILVLDEPVDGLDPVMRRQVWSLLMTEVERDETTVLLSSHNLRELEDVCDHVGIMDKGTMLLERSLADMQGNTVKLQLVGNAPEGLDVLHRSASGRMETLIVRGTAEELQAKMQCADCIYYDILPLSLEEIFIYELGGVNYEVKSIIL